MSIEENYITATYKSKTEIPTDVVVEGVHRRRSETEEKTLETFSLFSFFFPFLSPLSKVLDISLVNTFIDILYFSRKNKSFTLIVFFQIIKKVTLEKETPIYWVSN